MRPYTLSKKTSLISLRCNSLCLPSVRCQGSTPPFRGQRSDSISHSAHAPQGGILLEYPHLCKDWSFTIFQSPTPVTAPILRTWRHYWPFRRSTCDLQSSARLLLSRFLAQSGVGSREHRCSHCLRQLASLGGYPARSRHSSLRSHAENKIPPSAIPLGKTSGCRPSASYACKLSFLTRRTPASPRLKRLMRTDAKTLSVSPSDRV